MNTYQEQYYSFPYQKEIVKIAIKDLKDILLQFDRISFEKLDENFDISPLGSFKPNELKIQSFLDRPITISNLSQEEILFTKISVKNALSYFKQISGAVQELNPNKKAFNSHENFLFERMNEVLLILEYLSENIEYMRDKTNYKTIRRIAVSLKRNCDRLFNRILLVRYASFISYVHDSEQDYNLSDRLRLLDNLYSMTIDTLKQVQNILQKLNFSF